ncbi:MAG: exopolyphosphatase [Bauldia sp.]|nr:exopolyphosphatase [Bauldia sp.]
MKEHAPGRLNDGAPIAVIDIGSNSVRLVIYERLSRAPTQLFNEKALCGLGRGLSSSGKMPKDAIESALASIRRFAAINRQMGVDRVEVLATAAVREASNGKDFIRDVEALAGAKVATLSGPEEARLSALGIVSGFRNPDGVSGDLGGGSLELVDIRGDTIGNGETYPLGGLSLEAASGGSRSKAEQIASKALAGSPVLKSGKGRTFYAIGGTWRSLARLHMQQTGYPLRVMHHYAMKADDAADFCRMVSRHDAESLDSIEAVSKSRRPLLPFGAAVLGEIISVMKPSQVVMSALGLREGHLYELLPPAEQAQDPLIAASEELALLRSRSPRHARELAVWSDGAFAALGLEETAYEARLRKAVCLLADIGWRAHAEYRGAQSLAIIANAAFIGIDHPGRAFLALAVYYRHEGLGADSAWPGLREIVNVRMIERARAIGGAIRVAHMISAAMPGVIDRTRMERRGSKLTLVLPRDLAALSGDRVMRRLKQLAKLVDLEAEVTIEA